MQNKEQLLQQFSGLIPFVQSITQLDEGKWTTPIEEGKWTTRDVLAHIMLWDNYFLEQAIAKIATHQPVTVQHLDYDEFNRKAVEYAKVTDKQEIIDRTIRCRSEILRLLGQLNDEAFVKEHMDGDGHPFSAYQYLMDFILHDKQHIDQLKAFLGKAG
ncbi:DinB family protein [Paenibacillus nasutitermitis]|uniref:DinB-like domain-containing protein n=1 Tax=Paenibacillus nasutitermitis TaxID=1652958 RepID=A0A916YZN7_9BACL|nr:DinB family protein [Paenibacillus nasutitermitis]GGD68806.1 hypothetical protein GCM10010911_28240 [Paenibacillus nasutitermitis]